jgi:hypothetical protein
MTPYIGVLRKESAMPLFRSIMIFVLAASLGSSAARADEFLSPDEVRATQIGKTLSGKNRQGRLFDIVFENGGAAKLTSQFEADSTAFSDEGGWKFKSNGALCFRFGEAFGGQGKCVKIRKAGSKFELYGVKAGYAIFTYEVR